MNTEQAKVKLLEIVSNVVNSIANNEYERLKTLISLDSSWYDESGDITVAIKDFKNAIESNYSGWAEEAGTSFKINIFTEQNTDDDFKEIAEELLENGNSMMTYYLKTVDNDPDYFWLEINFSLASDDEITTIINLNF